MTKQISVKELQTLPFNKVIGWLCGIESINGLHIQYAKGVKFSRTQMKRLVKSWSVKFYLK